MQTIQPAITFGFGHLAPKPLTVSAETETLATFFYRKQAETAFSIGFGAETKTNFRLVSTLSSDVFMGAP